MGNRWLNWGGCPRTPQPLLPVPMPWQKALVLSSGTTRTKATAHLSASRENKSLLGNKKLPLGKHLVMAVSAEKILNIQPRAHRQLLGGSIRTLPAAWGEQGWCWCGGTCRVLATFCWFACTTVTADTGCQTCF